MKIVGLGKNFSIEFVYQFGDRVGGEGTTDAVLDFGQAGMVTVGRTGCSINEAVHSGIPGRYQHVEKTGKIGFVSGDGILDRARNRSERSLMKNVIHFPTSFQTGRRMSDVALHEVEVFPLSFWQGTTHPFQILPLAGSEVVQTAYRLIQTQ